MRAKHSQCRHFRTPIHHATCAAGVNYRALGDDSRPGYIARLPCVLGVLNKEPNACEKRDAFTDAEVEAREEEIKKRSEMTVKAIVLIKKEKKAAGHIECPKCKAKLSYSVAKSNGHIWGQCETKDCLVWMM